MLNQRSKFWLKQIHPRARKVRKYIRSRDFAQKYAIGSLIILAATTIYWSLLGAGIHSQNADQLVDPALFQDGKTLHGSLFPAAHSELIKWPLFRLIAFLGASGFWLRLTTV